MRTTLEVKPEDGLFKQWLHILDEYFNQDLIAFEECIDSEMQYPVYNFKTILRQPIEQITFTATIVNEEKT